MVPNRVRRTTAPIYLAAAAAARAMAAVRALAAAAAAAGICPFCGAIAAASAAGRPLYFFPVFFTALEPRDFAASHKPASEAFLRHRWPHFAHEDFRDQSKSCLNSNDARRESTATNSSVTRSGTRRENAFFLRIAIRRKSYHISPITQQISPAKPLRLYLQGIRGVPGRVRHDGAVRLLWRFVRTWRGWR